MLSFRMEHFLYKVWEEWHEKVPPPPPSPVQQALCKKFITNPDHHANLLSVMGYFGVQERNEVVNQLLKEKFEITCQSGFCSLSAWQ